MSWLLPMGMYLVMFPLQKIHMVAWVRWGLLVAFRLSMKVFSLWGFILVLAYMGFEAFNAYRGADTGVAHWAHLGGFLTGVAAAMAMMIGRLTHTGCDAISLLLGKHAWPLIGAPAGRAR